MNVLPIPMSYEGSGVFRALAGFVKVADASYGLGEIVPLAPYEERSSASHRQFFASVRECWMNLPDELAAIHPSADHLRKWALIKAGFRDERSVVCQSKAEAQRLATFIRPMDDFAVVSVAGTAIVVLTAKSQSMRSMGKAAFEESKARVLDILAELIGVEPTTLRRAEAA